MGNSNSPEANLKTASYSLFPTPYFLLPISYSLFPTPYSLLPYNHEI